MLLNAKLPVYTVESGYMRLGRRRSPGLEMGTKKELLMN